MMIVIIQPPQVMEAENWISPLMLMNPLLTVVYLIIHPVVVVGFGWIAILAGPSAAQIFSRLCVFGPEVRSFLRKTLSFVVGLR